MNLGCHVLSRGDRKKAVFRDEVDRQDFLKTLAEARRKTGFVVHACCRMNNHPSSGGRRMKLRRNWARVWIEPFDVLTPLTNAK